MTSKNYGLAAVTIGLLLSTALLLLPMIQNAPHTFAAGPGVTPTADKGKGPAVGTSMTFTDYYSGQQDTDTVICNDPPNNIVGIEMTAPAGSGYTPLHELMYERLNPDSVSTSQSPYCSSSRYPHPGCSSAVLNQELECLIDIDPNGEERTALLDGQTDSTLVSNGV
jgi:hypothetical protein